MDAPEGSGGKADAVLARLNEILQEVDMAVTTQRQITNKLAEEMGEDVYDYKALIKVSCRSALQSIDCTLLTLTARSHPCSNFQEHVTKFLASHSAQEGAADATTESHVFEQAAEATVGEKRKRDVAEDSNAEPKVPRPSQDNDEFAVELSDSRQVRVSKFKGMLYVNIREWYDKDGTLAPGEHSLPCYITRHSSSARHVQTCSVVPFAVCICYKQIVFACMA